MRARSFAAACVALSCGSAPPAAADAFTLLGGRLVLGGEASIALAGRDRGFFNYTEYGRTVVRSTRLSVSAELRGTRHLSLLTELRSDNLDSVHAYAAYLRVRPWLDHDVAVQVGRIPPVFGAFGRRRYGVDNPLVGVPLGYQYVTTLRPDAVAADADELQRVRGQGWLVGYSVGEAGRAPGLPLVNGLRWDTGAQVHVGRQGIALSAAITQGTLSRPRFHDDNQGKQLSAHLSLEPATGLLLGASAAGGGYLDDTLRRALPDARSSAGFLQRAWGVDAEYSRGHWLLRSEAIWTSWEVPALDAPRLPPSLAARALMLEGRYKVAPGLWLAARLDRLSFAHIAGSAGTLSWDAPVRRVEVGAGYSLHRNVSLKAGWQRNRRDGGLVRGHDLAMAQLLLWY